MALEKETIIEVAKKIQDDLDVYIHRDQLTLIISEENKIEVAKELRDNETTQFNQLLDVTAIDKAEGEERFELVYFLYSTVTNSRCRLKVKLQGEFPTAKSITSVWESANWYERETYDMYGIKFTDHPFLRRFYMPEDFVDPETGDSLYPLRKEFPLMGVPDSLPLPPFPEKYGEVE